MAPSPFSVVLPRAPVSSPFPVSSPQGSGSAASAGITGGYTGTSLSFQCIIAFFIGLGLYNVIELTVLVFVTFQKYSGLYFWSLLVSSWGVVPYSLGFLIKFFRIGNPREGHEGPTWAAVILLTIGWYSMVTGQSVVLWSRLHLLTRNQKVLRGLLIMIITNVVLLHFPTTVLTFGSNSMQNKDILQFVHGYNIMEKIQMTMFTIQEFIISGVYVWEALRILRLSLHDGARRTMFQLLALNVIIFIMDLGLLSCEYANLYIIETTLKGAVYSIKLKLEFAVLGKLVSFVTSGSSEWARRNTFSQLENSKERSTSTAPPFTDPFAAARQGSVVTHSELSPLPSRLRQGSISIAPHSLSPALPSISGPPTSMATPSDISDVSNLTTASAKIRKRQMEDFEANLARFEHVENRKHWGWEDAPVEDDDSDLK